MAPRSAALCFSAAATARSRHRRFLAVSCDARASDLLYSSLAAKLLGPPTSFDAGKLTVEFAHSHSHSHSHSKRGSIAFPRAYTLTHCDFTANLTLAVSDTIAADRLRADDVFAEWKQQDSGVMALHVHCFVSGANLLQGLAAGFRYHVFSKELPLVLKAVVHGDGLLFAEQPELLEAKVWVHFHSSSNKYNRLECWGPLREAANAKRHSLHLDGRLEQLQNAITNGKRRRTPDTIFSALLALLL
ncbi:hypothetical protein ABZP36_007427 [Zizania latifolia]